jgi:NADPH:quinone reductase-like Zn-dependent oxidoreductase
MVWTEYGPPEGLVLREVPRPRPKGNEVLVRVRATGVAAGDCELRALRFSAGMRILFRLFLGLSRPRNKILGQEFAGDVTETGPRVTRLRVGDPVFGTTGFRFGAYAEYVCVRETSADGALAIKPANLTYGEAATVPTGGLEAWHYLRKAGPLAGRRVLIIGAGGGIGMWATQLAKSLGAEVTGVDAPRKLGLMAQLGADRVVDFTREDCLGTPAVYDVILDVVGRRRTSECLRATRRGGHYLLANPRLGSMVRAWWPSVTKGRRVTVRGGPPRPGELDMLRRLIEDAPLHCVVDRQYPLEELPEAHRYLDSGLAIGRVVVLP